MSRKSGRTYGLQTWMHRAAEAGAVLTVEWGVEDGKMQTSARTFRAEDAKQGRNAVEQATQRAVNKAKDKVMRDGYSVVSTTHDIGIDDGELFGCEVCPESNASKDVGAGR